MAKLMEQTAEELMGTFVSISPAMRSFVEDEEFIQAMSQAMKKRIRNKWHATAVLFTDLSPYLFGEKHKMDTITILAAIEGEDPRKMMKRNGAEVMKDAIAAWDGQLKGFFLQLGISV